MSHIFYDHLIIFEEIEAEVKKVAKTPEEKEELWSLVDELIHHRSLEAILDSLPQELHTEFLDKFHKAPYDEGLMEYLKEKISENFEEILRTELGNLAYEIISEIRTISKISS